MKNYYKILKAPRKTESRFKPGFLMLECPEFIVRLFLTRPEKEIIKTRIFWDDSQAVTVEPSVLKAYQYHPKYMKA